MKKTTKKTKVAKEDKEFVLTFTFGDTVCSGTGSTVLEALQSIPRPTKITTKSVLTLENGGKKHTRALTIPLAKRLFYPAAQQYLAKDLSILLK